MLNRIMACTDVTYHTHMYTIDASCLNFMYFCRFLSIFEGQMVYAGSQPFCLVQLARHP